MTELLPSNLHTLLEAGSDEGINCLKLSRELDLETELKLEEKRAKEHFSKLKLDFLHLESKQRFLALVVKGDDSGLCHDVNEVLGGNVSMQNYAAEQKKKIQNIQEKNREYKNFLAEIKSYMKTLISNMKSDITKLLQVWSQVENSKSILYEIHDNDVEQHQSQLWQHTLSLCSQLSSLAGMLSQDDLPVNDANAAIEKINAFMTATPETTALFQRSDMDKVSEVLSEQISLLNHWYLQIQLLKTNDYNMNEMQIEQTKNSVVLSADQSLSPQISSLFKQLKISMNLLNCSLLTLSDEELCDRSTNHLPIMIKRIRVGVRSVKTANPLLQAYSSPEAFLQQLSAEKHKENEYYIVDMGVEVKNGEYEKDMKKGISLQLRTAKLIGVVNANDMNTLQSYYSESQVPVTSVMLSALEQCIQPISSTVASAAIPVIQHAITIKDTAFLLRELPHALQA